MNCRSFDIVIIGGGPAGSSAATLLSRAGQRVLLVEKAKFPRHKLCGEFVSPECLLHLRQLGVSEAVEEADPPKIFTTVFYSISGKSLDIPNSFLDSQNPNSIGLSRAKMDELLLEGAVGSGVDVRTETTFRAPIIENGLLAGVELRSKDGDRYSVKASLAIDATGRSRILARCFDGGVPKKPGLVAFKTHLRNASMEEGECEIYSYSGGYGGCTQIEKGLFNLCFIADAAAVKNTGSDPGSAVRKLVMQNRRAKVVLADSEFIGDWHAVPIAGFGRAPLVPIPGVMAIGDAAAFIDPFTGSGIALALQSSKLAADAILSSDDPKAIAGRYERTYRAAFDRRLRFCRFLRLASTSPRLASAALGLLGSSVSLTRMFAKATRSGALNTSG